MPTKGLHQKKMKKERTKKEASKHFACFEKEYKKKKSTHLSFLICNSYLLNSLLINLASLL